MDLVAGGINKEVLEQKHRDTINNKYMFSKYF